MSATSPIIPLFSTSASLKQGSIFTVEKAGTMEKAGRTKAPISLCDLAKAEGLSRLHLVESNFVSFMTAYKNLKEVGCDLSFGLKLVVCADMADKSDASTKTESKIVVFMRDGSAYKPLIQLYSRAATEGFYYVPRIDWRTLCALWHPSLLLALPFYSSFLAQNTTTFSSIVPQLPQAEHLVFREVGQDLPMDPLIAAAVDTYLKETPGATEQRVKSVYCATRAHCKPFMVWKCILNRHRGSTWDKPNLDQFTSREFCWQGFKELAAKPAVAPQEVTT